MTLLTPPASHPTHCPHCSSEQDIIAWGTGWMCRDCNFEWVTPIQNQDAIPNEIKESNFTEKKYSVIHELTT
ncbi:hypothetical protein [Morganella morganii]|uniref:hypothetical protein n=1 Tax=Morganella morganii TaxID=582 RepID=UPI002362B018|nr:hypothetical protein [Morganella morganii]